MLRNALYFSLKPFFPRLLRMSVRRWFVRRKLKRVGDSWPILAGSERKPAGWPGWPEGKKFAFVLTHDVESQRGLDRVKQLAELEMRFGFRSSFNFVPEGPYSAPESLRSWLTGNGFEVGVHDLHHDGKLYSSREEFRRKAERINQYAREWNASGFRSAFMLNRLEWLHDLDVQYDASTFDTDPFEPQPEGVGTIFPFFVTSLNKEQRTKNATKKQEQFDIPRSGYVELPYTLPQDSTLFLLMREKSVDIWKRKLDWVAWHGGLALVNIHPDYIDFAGAGNGRHEYPADRIIEFLEHVRARYQDDAWAGVPQNLARWYRNAFETVIRPSAPETVALPGACRPLVPLPMAGKRAAVLLYSYYPADPRPRRAAEALISAGMEVDLVCLRESRSEPAHELVNGVAVYRTPLERKRDSKLTYLKQYAQFIAFCFLFLAKRSLRRRYDLVHVHNMPDVLVFSALVPKLLGARVILDLHDPMPELMMGIYGLSPRHLLVRALRRLERWSIRFADLAVTPNIAFQQLFVSRSCDQEKVGIVMNSPESTIFDPDRFSANDGFARTSNGEFRIMHHGSIVHRHGIDLLVESVARLRSQIPGVRLDIYGSRTPFLDKVLDTAAALGIGDIVHFHGSKPQSEIASAIRECHVGVVPNRFSPFTELNFPTRLFEYLSMHRPVIAPATKGIRDYFGQDDLVMFNPGSVEDLADKILWVKANPELVFDIVKRGRQVYYRNLWAGEKARFLSFVADLISETKRKAPALMGQPSVEVPVTRKPSCTAVEL